MRRPLCLLLLGAVLLTLPSSCLARPKLHNSKATKTHRGTKGKAANPALQKVKSSPRTTQKQKLAPEEEEEQEEEALSPGTHSYDYDLVVIGGGSGGLACAKEAQELGARVAVFDYVKPSPAGSTWGLGGTCVNVGCIPKKLMHNAALLRECTRDLESFGWSGANMQNLKHSWDVLRSNVQKYIKGLNFGYKSELRQKHVTYINKHATFISPHELNCTDSKGKSQVITGARFVVAVGGRPSALPYPGGEHVITSDDIFSLPTSPGKVCVIGGGYVALECAGFLAGLEHGDVTVLVRSMPLRSFDRDVVKKVTDSMTRHPRLQILERATPTNVAKEASGKFVVTFNVVSTDEDGVESVKEVEEQFDTVISAVGRTPELSGLNLKAAASQSKEFAAAQLMNDRSGKLKCSNEQTSIPHIYAVGDVVHDAPELTPVAIMAGKLLSRRLFGGGTKTMVYKEIPTTVFTPLELGTVGLTEEEAIATYGESNVDCYLSSFDPLEWKIAEHRFDDGYSNMCLAKVVVVGPRDSTPAAQQVVGMHIACPNAGEIMQGFALAFRGGRLTYQDLLDTVGIHPTVAEEFTTMSVKRSSGQSTDKTGC